jgi:hypothetical protein
MLKGMQMRVSMQLKGGIMNISLALSRNKKAILVYDEPLGFSPSWVESSADGRGLRIIGDAGEEYVAGFPDEKTLLDIRHLNDLFMVRMNGQEPVETFSVSFVNQNYGDC